MDKTSGNRVECWTEGPSVESLVTPGMMVGTTCMLPEGHTGEHEGIRDDEIVITFAPKEI